MSNKNRKPPTTNTMPKPPNVDFQRDFVETRAKTSDNIGGIKQSTLTQDSFANFSAKIGIQTNNLSSQGYYNLGPFITRNRLELEAAYRGNWLVGKIVDCVAEDMTRDGIEMHSDMEPDDIKQLQVAMSEFSIWHDLCSCIKWSRLYGGCLAIMVIDGADYSKPLNIEAIGKDKFKGLIVLDRWMVQPTMGDLITDLCKDIGKPKFYETLGGISQMPSMKIHYSRVLRFDGIELPYYQKLFENLWGLSVVERMLDRLMAFDSATLGAAQLIYKSHLRIIGVEGFREALANGGKSEEAVIKQFKYIQLMQCNEGITVLDAKDTFNTHTASARNITDVLDNFAEQISGCEGIPLIRLFGQSPRGFSTGEADVRNYYDEIAKRQENDIRPIMDKLLAVIAVSTLGKALPEDFEFKFKSLWQMTEEQKSQIASQDSSTISNALQGGLISQKTALKELSQLARLTNRFSNITQEDIDNAEETIPSAEDLMGGMEGMGGELPPDEGGMSGEMPDEGGIEQGGESKPDEDPNSRLGSENPDLEKEQPEEKSAEAPIEKMEAKDSQKAKQRFLDAIRANKAKRSQVYARLKALLGSSPQVKMEAPALPKPDPQPENEPEVSSNTAGIIYKGYVIKQDDQGKFRVFTIGGALVVTMNSLEETMNKINSIAITGKM